MLTLIKAYVAFNQKWFYKTEKIKSSIIKKLCRKAEFFNKPLRALDLSGTKATGANTNSSVSTVHNSLYLTDIGLPGSIGLTVGVRHVVSEGYALTADAALSHFYTSKNSALASVFLYIFLITHKSADVIITY